MCTIGIRPKGKVIPEKYLKAMFENNTDGAGLMYAKGGKVVIRKGFMKVDDFLKAVENVPKDVDLFLHCRIGTSGGKVEALTHPFVVATALEDITATDTACNLALMHNGVFYDYKPSEKDEKDKGHSDTTKLIRDAIAPLCQTLVRYEENILLNGLKPCLSALFGRSRVVLLNGKGQWRTYGEWVVDEETGCYFSNDNYKPKVKSYTSCVYSGGQTYTLDDWKVTEFEDKLCLLKEKAPLMQGNITYKYAVCGNYFVNKNGWVVEKFGRSYWLTDYYTHEKFYNEKRSFVEKVKGHAYQFAEQFD